MATTLRLVMTLLVRDEADILWQQLQFHRAQGIDHFIITDNLSVDETPAIIQRAVACGWATAMTAMDDDYRQSEWVSAMARRAADEFAADWVINSDADEFWLARSGCLRDAFAAVPAEYGVLRAQRYDGVSDRSDRRWYERMQHRCVKPHSATGRPLPPKVAHRAHSAVLVLPGNHRVSGLPQPAVLDAQLEILHFPTRTIAQFENKIRKGGAAMQRNSVDGPGINRKWRKLYQVLQREGTLAAHLSPYFRSNWQLAVARFRRELIRDTRVADLLRTVH